MLRPAFDPAKKKPRGSFESRGFVFGGAGGMVNRMPHAPLQATDSVRLSRSASAAMSHLDGAG